MPMPVLVSVWCQYCVQCPRQSVNQTQHQCQCYANSNKCSKQHWISTKRSKCARTNVQMLECSNAQIVKYPNAVLGRNGGAVCPVSITQGCTNAISCECPETCITSGYNCDDWVGTGDQDEYVLFIVCVCLLLNGFSNAASHPFPFHSPEIRPHSPEFRR